MRILTLSSSSELREVLAAEHGSRKPAILPPASAPLPLHSHPDHPAHTPLPQLSPPFVAEGVPDLVLKHPRIFEYKSESEDSPYLVKGRARIQVNRVTQGLMPAWKGAVQGRGHITESMFLGWLRDGVSAGGALRHKGRRGWLVALRRDAMSCLSHASPAAPFISFLHPSPHPLLHLFHSPT